MKNIFVYLVILTKSVFPAAFSNRLRNQIRDLKRNNYHLQNWVRLLFI